MLYFRWNNFIQVHVSHVSLCDHGLNLEPLDRVMSLDWSLIRNISGRDLPSKLHLNQVRGSVGSDIDRR